MSTAIPITGVDPSRTIKSLRQQRADLKGAGLAIVADVEAKGRNFTDEERTKLDALATQLQQIDQDLGRMDAFRESQRDAAIEGAVTAPPKKLFGSLGEQLKAVVTAGRNGRVDSRLLELSAGTPSGTSEGVPADGGFLVQQDFSTALLQKAYDTGILARMVTKIPVSPESNGIKLPAVDETSRANGSRWGGVQAFWAQEADAATAKKPAFRRIDLELKKLIALCYATDELLQDAGALNAVINKAFPEEVGFMLDDAIIRGDGVGKPLGILNSLAKVAQAAEGGQTATTVNATNVVKMFSRMPARLIAGAQWFINQNVFPQLPLMVIGQSPVFLPPQGGDPGLSGAPLGTLLGKPINIIEQCESLGTEGDIIFANLGEYIMIDKGGLQSAVSIHVRFLNDESTFRWTYRCDGQPGWNKALTPYKGATTLSPFVTLAAR